MPSPIAHSMIGLAMGIARWAPRPAGWRELAGSLRRNWKLLLVAVVFANGPDLDYLPGILVGRINEFHHGYTHALGWILLVSVGSWLCWRALDERAAWRDMAFLFALMAVHLAADLVTRDMRPPEGIMALWPFSGAYWHSGFNVFGNWLKADWSEVFQRHNARLALLEVAKTAPVVLIVLLYKRYVPWHRLPGPAADAV